mmetsp:Transcript_8905/g.17387  ORF Transcript_8905/g.17387 Transcript_8905/m.17387 type:complete len:309 (+) Transcript_8905:283-1209(+)
MLRTCCRPVFRECGPLPVSFRADRPACPYATVSVSPVSSDAARDGKARAAPDSIHVDGGQAPLQLAAAEAAELQPTSRPYCGKVRRLVNELLQLSQKEADELSKTIRERMTPGSAAPASGQKNFTPLPVRSRVPFPHVAALFGGLRANLSPGVRPLQYMPPLGSSLMAPHAMEQMESLQQQMQAAASIAPAEALTQVAAPHTHSEAVGETGQNDDRAASAASDETGEQTTKKGGKEKTVVTVRLTGLADPTKKIQVIKEVRSLTKLGLKEAKDLVEAVPKALQKGVPREEAVVMQQKLEAAGATVLLD